MKTTYSTKLARMASYLRANPEVTLPSGRVISAVELAIVRIYQRQTQDEKASDCTNWDNNRGFQQVDAKFGGKMARVIMSGERVWPGNMARCIRMAVKYRRQLVELAEKKHGKVTLPLHIAA